jgi:valyl-tRNA synthetase
MVTFGVVVQLWQALPKKAGEAPSICVAYFPIQDKWASDAAEERFKAIKDVIVHIRSVAAEGNLDTAQPECTCVCARVCLGQCDV